jgi:DNA transposition AAA+ family ATPase
MEDAENLAKQIKGYEEDLATVRKQLETFTNQEGLDNQQRKQLDDLLAEKAMLLRLLQPLYRERLLLRERAAGRCWIDVHPW